MKMPMMGDPRQGTLDATPSETVELTLTGVGIDTSRRAFMEGRGGGSANLAYAALPALDPVTDADNHYVWWSQGGYNADPGDHVAALSGWTGIEVALGSGAVTANSRATSTRTAIDAVPGLSAGGSGPVVSISGAIDSALCAVGGAYVDRGTAGLFGHHTSAPLTNGNPFADAIAVHGTFTAGPGALTAIGVLLGTPSGESVRVALYVGGSESSFVGTTLVAEGVVTATSTGNVYAWLPLTAAQSAAIADNASVWVTAKADAGGTLFPAFSSLANCEDWTARNLVIFSGIDTDPTVAWPSTLEGEPSDIATGNAVVMMAAFEYRTAPYASDASVGGITTDGIILGMHTDGVLAASESALTSPDAGGANVLGALSVPAIAGKLETYRETALRDEFASGGQMRTAEYSGGSAGDPDGATLLQDHGAIGAAASMAWVGQNASPEVALPDTGVIHLAIRGNGGITVGFVAGASPDSASPADDPSDFTTTAVDEYETNTDNPAHSTNDAVAFESTFATDPDDLQPGNYPGLRIRWRVPGDTIAPA